MGSGCGQATHASDVRRIFHQARCRICGEYSAHALFHSDLGQGVAHAVVCAGTEIEQSGCVGPRKWSGSNDRVSAMPTCRGGRRQTIEPAGIVLLYNLIGVTAVRGMYGTLGSSHMVLRPRSPAQFIFV